MNLKNQSEAIRKISKITVFIQEQFRGNPGATMGDNTSSIEKLKMYYETFTALLTGHVKEKESYILLPVKY